MLLESDRSILQAPTHVKALLFSLTDTVNTKRQRFCENFLYRSDNISRENQHRKYSNANLGDFVLSFNKEIEMFSS
jgi:hypothetical protein